MGTGAWAPHSLPLALGPLGLGVAPPQPVFSRRGSRPSGQLGSPGPKASQRPGRSSARPGRCRLVHSFDLGPCFPSAKKRLKQGREEGSLPASAEKLRPGALQLPSGRCAQFTGLEGRAMTSAWGWATPRQDGNRCGKQEMGPDHLALKCLPSPNHVRGT